MSEPPKNDDMNSDVPPPFPPRATQKPAPVAAATGARRSGDVPPPFPPKVTKKPAPPTMPVPQTPIPAAAGKTTDAWYTKPIGVGLLLAFFFPVGLFLVWKHPRWTKRTKWIWTGVWAGVILVGAIGSSIEEQKAAQSFADANALWNSGKKAEAVSKYRSLLGNPRAPRELDRHLVRDRIIIFDAEQGNLDEAKNLINEALDHGEKPSLESSKAQELLLKAVAERAARERAVAEKAAAEKAAAEKAAAEQDVITADFFPHRPGTRQVFVGDVFLLSMRFETLTVQKPEGIIEETTIRTGIIGKGVVKWLDTPLKLDHVKHYRIQDGFNATTHLVGTKKPNSWGLYDMHGTLWEWCQDWYDQDYYAKSPKDDPRGPTTGSSRVQRGGSWYDPAFRGGSRLCRSASRGYFPPEGGGNTDGFRVCLVPAEK